MNWDVWGPPLVVLGVGAVLGAALAIRTIQQGRRAHAHASERLAAEKEQLLEALHEIDADRGKLGDEAWQAKREALLQRAASTLRALDQGEPGATEPERAPAKPVPAAWSRLAWGAGVAAFFVGLAWVLTSNTGERVEGQPMTGGSTAMQERPEAPEIAAARATLEKDPNNLDALNALTWHAIRSRDLNGAMSTLDKARAVAPEDPYVLTHLAVLQVQIGMHERAEATLLQALEKQPDLPRAMLFLGLARMERGDREGAVATLEKALASPVATDEERQMLAAMLSEAKAPPPQLRVSGTVALASDLSAPPKGLLFIMAKRSADGGGPPVAALRVTPDTWPHTFAMGDKNMMLGGEWPEQVWVQARLDSDGNPSTKSEDDVESAVVGPLPSGAVDVALVLGGS